MQALLHTVPPSLQQDTIKSHLCWRLLDTHRQIWLSHLWSQYSFSWVLVCTRFFLRPPRVCFPVLHRSDSSMGGRGVGVRSTATRAPVPVAVYFWPISPQETLTHSSVLVSVESLGPGAHKVCLSPLSVSGRYGFFLNVTLLHIPFYWCFSFSLGHGVSQSFSSAMQPPLQCCAAMSIASILLGLLFPCIWGISSKSLQHHTAATPAQIQIESITEE